ncbi:MAG: hypothetical protein IKY61_01925, partial [Thermoguttaceae bacterium]|nr:hypothetical protein [Thermoguttaceae bacterium]
VAPVPQVAQSAPTTQVPFAPQSAYVAPIPQVAQSAPTTQVPFAPQSAYVAPVPQVAQSAPTTVSQYAAPTASRRPSTPEERLQAAIAAGAEVREISPEEYRRAVQVGMSGQAQSR